jgi:cytochrome c oxidase assembly factor CtaG
LSVTLCVAALIYYRGWVRLRQVWPTLPSRWWPYAFVGGLFALWAAIGSPLAALDEELLSVHMVQHILLSLLAPPLILLGAPALPLLYGIPRLFKLRRGVARLVRSYPVRALGRGWAQPAICWTVAMAVFIGWHLPPLFQLGLRSEGWHAVEHASFLGSGLMFWWPVVQPWPSTPKWPRWSVPLYLFAATLPCDGLSAFLAFSDRVVYRAYLSAPRRFGLSALQDQECAGALMWLCVTIAYVIPAAIVTTQLFSARTEDPVMPLRTNVVVNLTQPRDAENVQVI